MTDEILLHRIALSMVSGVGAAQHRMLIEKYGSASAVLDCPLGQLVSDGVPAALARNIKNRKYLDDASRELDFVVKNNVKVFYYTDSDYPYRLAECKDAPPLFYFRGNCSLDSPKMVAFVGTRKMTEYGRKCIVNTISELAASHKDLLVVSGLAYGVDVCSHQAALDNGLPTLAVMGTSHASIYPSAHRGIAAQMLRHGGLLSEYHTSQSTDRGSFVARNRIIAGLCDAVVVVESGLKGGALLTAEFANSYSRDVFAFPGRVGDVYSEGCNKLIMSNSAALVSSAQDIENMLGWAESKGKCQPSLFPELTTPGLSDDEKRIITTLRANEQMHIDELAMVMDMPVFKVQAILFQMEFRQLVRLLPGGVYTVG